MFVVTFALRTRHNSKSQHLLAHNNSTSRVRRCISTVLPKPSQKHFMFQDTYITNIPYFRTQHATMFPDASSPSEHEPFVARPDPARTYVYQHATHAVCCNNPINSAVNNCSAPIRHHHISSPLYSHEPPPPTIHHPAISRPRECRLC